MNPRLLPDGTSLHVPMSPCVPRTNLPPPGSGVELGRCRFHPQLQPLCPILRLGDVARLAGQDFPALAATVSGDAGDMGGTGGEWGGCGDIGVQAGGMKGHRDTETWDVGHENIGWGDMGWWDVGMEDGDMDLHNMGTRTCITWGHGMQG